MHKLPRSMTLNTLAKCVHKQLLTNEFNHVKGDDMSLI